MKNKLNIKIQNFCSSKYIKTMKRQVTDKIIFANHISEKRFVSGIYEELSK